MDSFVMSLDTIIRYVKRRLHLLMWHTDPTGIRVVLALGAILWGIMLFWPGATFDRPTYSLMAQFASEEVWASLFLTQGLYALYNVVFVGPRSKFCLFLDGAFGSVLWLGSCVCMLMSVYPPPAAISGEIVLALASWWNLITFNYKDSQ